MPSHMKEEVAVKDKEIQRLMASATHSGKMQSRVVSTKEEQEVQILQAELKALQARVLENESTILSLRSELSQKNDQLSFLTDEKVVGEEALEASQRECSQLTSLIKELDENIAQLTSALATRTKERDNAVSAEKREVEVRLIAEAELQKKCKSLECQLQGSRAEQKQLQAYLEDCKKEIHQNELKSSKVASELHEKQMQLQTADKEIEQLKNLVTQLDLTREQLVDKLQSTMAHHQLAENRLINMEGDLRRISGESEARNAEVLHLHSLIETLAQERDHMETELRIHLETFSQVQDENKRLATEVLVIRKELQKSEQALQGESLQLRQADTKISSLKEQLSVEEASRKVFEERCAAKTAELRDITEELTRMTCEQQLVKSELRQMVMERENLIEELRNMESKLNFSEQVFHAKEKEEKEMMLSYQKLCDDYQKIKLATIEMDTQNRQLRFQLQSTEELHFTTQERAKSLDEELQKCTTDLKNMEREAERLSRLLAQQSALLEDCQKEKSALSAQVANFRQVAIEMEQKHENISRDMGALEAQNRILTDVLQERAQENEALAARYRLEQEHVREVEKLLSYVRAQEHQWELENKESETKNALMRERLFSLDEQVKMLQATRDAQNKEIMRLQVLLQNKKQEASHETKRQSFGFPSMHSFETQDAGMLKELEARNASLTADLSKTSVMYNDCLDRLQRTEGQCAQQKKDYDHMLELLAKVDEERTQLQKKCTELLARTEALRQNPLNGSPKEKVLQLLVNGKFVEQGERDSTAKIQ